MGEKILNIPNAVTLVRFILVIPFIYMLFIGENLSSLFIFLLAVLSDKLDGTLARRLKQETQFGKTFDALTDSLMVISGLVALFVLGYIPIILAIMIFLPRIITAILFLLFFIPKKIKFFTTIYSRVAALFVYTTIAFIMLEITILIYGLIIGIYILSFIHWYEMVKVKKDA